MRLEIDIAEHHYNNIMALDSVSLGRVPYKGIIMYSINAIKHGKVLDQEPKTGEWIEHFDESGKWYECDQCHTDWGGAVNFCPNCGADMRGDLKE
jgi:hypothetical protein